jgi:hypothetical protein
MAGYENPWCFARLPESNYVATDMIWQAFSEFTEPLKGIRESIAQRVAPIKDVESLKMVLGSLLKVIPSSEMFVTDAHDDFLIRVVKSEDAGRYVKDDANLIHDNPAMTVFSPPSGEVLELCYDLGRQVCGFYEVELVAEAGVAVDIMGVEYIAANGTIQHTQGNRNGLRYITKAGNNHFISLVRRSGRYLFVTDARRPQNPAASDQFPTRYRIGSPAVMRLIGWGDRGTDAQVVHGGQLYGLPLYEQTYGWGMPAMNRNSIHHVWFNRYCTPLHRGNGTIPERYPLVGAQVRPAGTCFLPGASSGVFPSGLLFLLLDLPEESGRPYV